MLTPPSSDNPGRLDRREVLRAGAVSIAIPWFISGPSLAARGSRANDTIGIGIIGLGIRGRRLMNQLMDRDDVRIVGVSEIAGPRLLAAMKAVEDKDGAPCAGYLAYEDLLERRDLDAVVIATHDSTHARPAILAARRGLDIYCEKPLALTISEGRRISDAVRAGQVVFQTGSQQRSEYGGLFRTACEHVRNGRIGPIERIEVGVGDPPVPCDLPEEDTPAGYDWERWLSGSPARGFHESLCPRGVHGHYPQWRQYAEYGNGPFADMGAHHYDIAQWAMDTDHTGPIRILPPERDDGSRAVRGLVMVYENGIEVVHGGRHGCTFHGRDGTIHVDRGVLEASEASILEDPPGDGDLRLPVTGGHVRNWIDCIRSRARPICHEEIGHRTATVNQLAVIGYELDRPLTWDPARERFTGAHADEANARRSRASREAWTIPPA